MDAGDETPRRGDRKRPEARRLRFRYASIVTGVTVAAVACIGSLRSHPNFDGPIELRGPIASSADDELREVDEPPGALRLVSFNMHSGKPPGGDVDLGGTAATLRPICVGDDVPAAVVVALNEVRDPVFRDDQAMTLAGRLGDGFSSAFLPAERRWFRDHFGNALLTNTPTGAVLVRPLPRVTGKAFRVWATTGVAFGGTRLAVFATHVDSRGDRGEQLGIVTALFLRCPPPVALIGDLNTPLDDPTLAALLEAGVTNALADADGLEVYPDHIDHIFVRGLEVTDAAIVATDASDHPLVWADVRLPRVEAYEADGVPGE